MTEGTEQTTDELAAVIIGALATIPDGQTKARALLACAARLIAEHAISRGEMENGIEVHFKFFSYVTRGWFDQTHPN